MKEEVNLFFHLLTVSLNVSQGLKWSLAYSISMGLLFIHLVSLCLLVGAFNPFTFKVIINIYVPTSIFLIVLGLFL